MSTTWPETMPEFGPVEEQVSQPEPAPASADKSGPQQCPECQMICVSTTGLARHRMAAHGAIDTEGKQKCEVEGCASWVIPGSMGRHMRNVHNIYGGVSGQVRTSKARRGRPPGAKNVRSGGPTLATYGPEKMVKADKPEKLPPLTAEQITRAAAEALWPKGIPHDKLTLLLRWNNQTHDFLTEVSQ